MKERKKERNKERKKERAMDHPGLNEKEPLFI